MPVPGQIWRHAEFYLDGDGRPQPKYMLILGNSQSGDVLFRVLTSRQHGRPRAPKCFHGYPYSGYFLGVLGGPLTEESWVDLGKTPDMDDQAFERLAQAGTLTLVATLPAAEQCAIMRCVANEENTTYAQSQSLLDCIAAHFPGM